MGDKSGVDYQNLQAVRQSLESRYNLFERNRRDKQNTITYFNISYGQREVDINNSGNKVVVTCMC